MLLSLPSSSRPLIIPVQELKAALLTEEQPLPGCGSTWRAQLEVCIQVGARSWGGMLG